jgi:FKBP-type peptidyl-prolyl cis-trans isomerase
MTVRLLLLLCAAAMVQAQPPVNGVPVELATLRYIDIAEGTGVAAAAGKRFTVHYTGWLKDGAKFDSSVDRNEPLDFVQGRRQVIAGWDVGFEGMKVGGKRRLFIPYQLAYGEAGSGPIPPKAELIFDVELLGVADIPTVTPGVDVLLPFLDLEARVTALARAIPAEKYASPAASTRTVAQLFMRIADSTKLMDSLAGDELKPVDLDAKLEEKTKTPPPGKEAILALLTANFAETQKEMETARNGFLSSQTELFGKPTTKRGVLTWLDTSIAEQLGQAIAFAHANGIAIPWTAAELR